MLLDQSGDVPDPDGLIQGGRDNQVLLRVELSTHDIVVVASKTGNLLSVLPVPDSDGLVIGGGNDPWQLVVKKHRSDVVQMAGQSEHALSGLGGPDLDCVVITTGNKDRLCWVERNTSDRPVVVLETVNQRTHSVVPELDGRRMQRNKKPWPSRMEGNTLGPRRLRFKLQ